MLRGALAHAEVERLTARLVELEQSPPDSLPVHCVPSRTAGLDELRLYHIHECDDLFLRLLDHPAWISFVDDLVPGPARSTEAFSISRRKGLGVPLHHHPLADYRVVAGRPQSRYVKASIALSECGPQDGALVVLEGSHKLGAPMPYAPVPADWPIPEYDSGFARQFVATECKGKTRVPWSAIPGYRELHVAPGDVILFTEDLWHGALAVRSGRTRRSLYFGYSPYYMATWHGLSVSPELLARASPRQRALLGGPFAGNRFPAQRTPAVPGSASFPAIPDSELAAQRWLRPEPAHGDTTTDTAALLTELTHRTVTAGRDGVCALVVAGDTWQLRVDAGRCTVQQGEPHPADARLELRRDALHRLVHGDASAVQLFYAGDVTVCGDVSLAMQVADLLSPYKTA
ncbi:MAG: phytanoyl-CoA dioxygenase family protein [Planctomycetes bacterium]|nr:phytanoyl-CoA dioxygenase family protein [Planctomycetota bacterium]